MEMRSATRSDLSQVVTLYRYLNPEDPDGTAIVDLESIWEQSLSDKNIHYFVGEIYGKLVCSCLLAIIPNLTRGGRPFGVMQNVVTHPDFRGQGLATRLLAHANEFAWSQNCYQILLQTGRPETHRFYRGAGYRDDLKTGFVAKPSC